MKKNLTAEEYRDAAGEFRWRLRARNGNIKADGGEGYKTRAGAHKALARLVSDLSTGNWEWQKTPVSGLTRENGGNGD